MKTIYTLLFAAAALSLGSCEHKKLCYDHTHSTGVNVVFDWQNAPEASPATMSLYLLPTDGRTAQRYEFTNREGGRITPLPGTYDAICLNSDTEAVLLRGLDLHETFEAYTRSASLLETLGQSGHKVPQAEGTEDEPVVLTPDMLWTDHAEAIVIVASDEEQTITLYPKTAVSTYTFEIRNAANLNYVTALGGSLTSMAGSYFPGRDELAESLSTIPFEAHSDGVSTVSGGFLTFGYHPMTTSPHNMVIYAVLLDGSKWYYTYDVTDQIHNAADKRHVNIVLDGLPLPKPIVNGGGFQPGIDEWQQIDVDIEM